MITVVRRLPLVVDQPGHPRLDYRTGRVAALTWRPDSPYVATFHADHWQHTVTVEGLAVGLHEEWVEPHGTATIRTRMAGGHRFVVVDLHHGGGASIIASAARVSDFVGHVAFTAILGNVRAAADRETPWLLGGGAA